MILAVETAFRSVSVALQAGGEIFEPRTDLGAARAAGLHLAVEDVLAQAQATANELDALLVDVGPGSYTGLRVGLAMARTFRQLLQVEISALYSFDLLAMRGLEALDESQRSDFFVAADARRGQWFLARYRAEEDALVRVEEASCVPLAELDKHLRQDSAVVTASGASPIGATTEVGEPRACELFACKAPSWREDDPAPRYLMPALPT